MVVPRGIEPGWIYHHSRLYKSTSGKTKPKFFLVLAKSTSYEVVARVLTSKPHGRPRDPPCFHGYPYPGHFIGTLCGSLKTATWVDLRGMNDFDEKALNELQTQRIIEPVTELSEESFLAVLDCVASAEDTTRYQETLIRDLRAKIAES